MVQDRRSVLFLGIGTAIAALLADQASKWLMMERVVADGKPVELAGWFNLVRAWNPGVSFSMFDGHGIAGAAVLSLVALVIVAALLKWLHGEKNRLIQLALGLIIGGALGNVADRLRFGAVFDFVDWHYGGSHWPAFNLADSFICAGAAAIIFHGLFLEKKEENKK